MEFLQDRDVYAVGGYFVNYELNSISVSIDFTKVDSAGAAPVIALKEFVQCAAEGIECNESYLEFRSYSRE